MLIETKHSVGDVVYIVNRLYCGESWKVYCPMPVEEIEVFVAGDTITERYKCETIDGFYPADKVFADKALAETAAKELDQQEATA